MTLVPKWVLSAMRFFTLISSLALFALPFTAASAEKIEFDVSVAGINAGVLAIDGSETSGAYEVRGSARSNRMISAIVDMRVDAVSTGQVSGNSYRPASYKAVSRENDKKTEQTFKYSGGIPSVVEKPARSKPRKHAVSPETQAGSVDPLTAIYALLRDRPAELACDLDIQLFDGSRSSRVSMSKGQKDGGDILCSGTYTRLAGYSPDDMKKRKSWAVTMIYQPGRDGAKEVHDLRFSTDIGNVRLQRR